MKKNIFIVTALLFSIAAKTQDTTTTLSEVVVTANKFPNKTSLTGKVVTVINRDQIEKSGGKDLSQLLTEQVGVFINGANSNAGKDKSLYLRGAKVDHTLICLDGVPIYDPSGIGSNFDLRLLSIDNIERIEILKGSQSTLYGSDAMAGVINIISRKASKKKIDIGGMLTYGSYNTIHGNASISGHKNIFDYQINYSLLSTKGINEAEDTITATHLTDKDGYHQRNFSIALGIRPNNKISIQPYFRFSSIKQDFDQGPFLDELDITSSNDNYQVGIKNEFVFNKWRLNVLYNLNNNERAYTDDSTKSRNGYDIYSTYLYKGKEHYFDAFTFFSINEHLKFTGGIDFRSSNTDQNYLSIGYYGPYESNLGKDSLKQNQISVYGAMIASSKKGFNIELGSRMNIHSAYGRNFVYNFNPSYLLNNRWKFYANISTAYKTPSLYQLYSEYGNKNLKPEEAFTIESGLQYFSSNNKTSSRINYFNRQVKQLIAFFYNPLTYQSYYINQDKQNDYGIEVETNIKVNSSTTIKGFYSFVDGKIMTINNDKDTSFFNLIRRPKGSFGCSINKQFNKNLFCSMGLNSIGKRTDITYDINFNQQNVILKAYTILNFYTEYSMPNNKWRFFIDVKNLTNTEYNEAYGFNTMRINGNAGIRFRY